MTRIQKLLVLNGFTIYVATMMLLLGHGLAKNQQFFASLNDGTYDHSQYVLTDDVLIEICEGGWIKAQLVKEGDVIVGFTHVQVTYLD